MHVEHRLLRRCKWKATASCAAVPSTEAAVCPVQQGGCGRRVPSLSTFGAAVRLPTLRGGGGGGGRITVGCCSGAPLFVAARAVSTSATYESVSAALRTLSLTFDATDDEVKKAYLNYAKRNHPDSNQQSAAAQEMMEMGNAAYALLRLCKYDERQRLRASHCVRNERGFSGGAASSHRAERAYQGRKRSAPPGGQGTNASSYEFDARNTAYFNTFQQRMKEMRRRHDQMGAAPWRVDGPRGGSGGRRRAGSATPFGFVREAFFGAGAAPGPQGRSLLDQIFEAYTKNPSFGGMNGARYNDPEVVRSAKYRMRYAADEAGREYGPDDPIHGSPFMKSQRYWEQQALSMDGTTTASQKEIFQDHLLRKQRAEEKTMIDAAIGPRLIAGLFLGTALITIVLMVKTVWTMLDLGWRRRSLAEDAESEKSRRDMERNLFFHPTAAGAPTSSQAPGSGTVPFMVVPDVRTTVAASDVPASPRSLGAVVEGATLPSPTPVALAAPSPTDSPTYAVRTGSQAAPVHSVSVAAPSKAAEPAGTERGPTSLQSEPSTSPPPPSTLPPKPATGLAEPPRGTVGIQEPPPISVFASFYTAETANAEAVRGVPSANPSQSPVSVPPGAAVASTPGVYAVATSNTHALSNKEIAAMKELQHMLLARQAQSADGIPKPPAP